MSDPVIWHFWMAKSKKRVIFISDCIIALPLGQSFLNSIVLFAGVSKSGIEIKS